MHCEICIQFELAGRKFEAVGILERRIGDLWVDARELISRMNNGRVVNSEEIVHLITDHTQDLPSELRPYCIVTNFRSKFNEFVIAMFVYRKCQWEQVDDFETADCYYGHPLVLRHRE
ncbi:hypothetical protein HZA86_00895 [Candidatus Uhrbacteria bacterium]|nr:hypothetical protein [Candidatus Uhrbacteria bacterium]